ncbi:PREDICTED: uncharacterized protein LOC104822898 isoform X2 [Tarenaya hassleriana]|uniref:uncharacterized protein LOC104822898 isoform X2 n=1 Tax=Tarenaya hassleriana TaxID=28532 RepID=UPI00053C660E|nr:PREDICTED: uncharacterized protein LOC104822898 isoform X2 [Tarenaya hassleriana]
MLKQAQDFQLQQISGSGFSDLRSLNDESLMGMNRVQGSIHQGDVLQDACSISPNPPQVVVSLYDSSAASGKSSMNSWSGPYLQSAYLTTSHVEKDQKTITRSQGFDTSFVNTCSRDPSVMPEGFQEQTPFMSSSVLGSNGDSSSLRDQENLLGMQQTPRISSQGSVALDPLEEKILYHMDDNVQDSSFGRNNSEISSSGFSLSALMQCALAEETGPLDGNGDDQIPSVHSFTSNLENACSNASWMNQSCLASLSSVHPFPNLHDFPQHADRANRSDIPGESEKSGTGPGYIIKGQTHIQETCNSSLPSRPSDLSTYGFRMNAPIGQHQLVGAANKFPLSSSMVQQKPSEVYNAPPNALSDRNSSFYFSKSSFDIHQNSATVGQRQHNEFEMGYLKTDDDGPIGETRPKVSSVLTGHSYQFSVGNYVEKISSNAWNPDIGPIDSAMQCDAVNQNMVALRQKKRKSTTFSQSPWHNVVLRGSDMSRSISLSEEKWALATNRLLEKVEDDKVGPSEAIPPSKRRLILSTRLMRQLLPPAPSFTLSGNAAVCYESIVYIVARVALGEACSLACYGLNMLQSHSDTSEKICDEMGKAGDKDQQYAQTGKAFVEKTQKLESDFQRLDKTASIVEIIVEIQDIERFSVMNHFARFHSRMSKSVPRRYVTGLPMPKILLPEGVHCLPL